MIIIFSLPVFNINSGSSNFSVKMALSGQGPILPRIHPLKNKKDNLFDCPLGRDDKIRTCDP